MSHAFLSALDAMFLSIEDECNHMHVALTGVFEKGPLENDRGSLDMDRIRRYAEQVLADLPKFRQRLAWTQWLRHPVLVDDTRFDLNAHLRHVTLDPPGGDAELKALMGRLYSRPLDRTRPLWEQWYVDGLAGGRFAVVTKAHHCMVDGVAGIGALTSMLRTDQSATIRDVAPWKAEPLPSGRALLVEEITHRLREPSALVDVVRRRLDSTLRDDRRSLAGVVRAGTAAMVRSALPCSRTRLNPKRIGSARHFDWVRIDFGRARAIKRRTTGKINDVVLACVTGAVRRYLIQHGDDVRRMRFRALIPVSLHDASQSIIHNEVSLMLATLPVSEPDPKRRLEALIEETSAAKASGQTDLLGLAGAAADVAARGAIAASAKAMIRLLPFNVVVTNIPGPPFPLYLLGARMLAAYPMVPLYMNQAVGVAVVSYDGGLYFGLNADAAHLPDVSALAHALEASVVELEAAYGLS